MEQFLPLGLFLFVMMALIIGYPVAFTLAGASIIWAIIAVAMDFISFTEFGALPSRIYGSLMNNSLLIAIPIFIFMGTVLEKSKIAEDLLESMGQVFARIPGGLGISVFIVGALLAASTGVVGATVVTMGLMTLPYMLKQGYKPSLATGSICASGTLGQIIPPSIILILLGDQISNSYTEAQRSIGNWAPEPVTVGDLFAGALIPGFMLVGLYILYQIVYALIFPKNCPPVKVKKIISLNKLIINLFTPLILIVLVLGSVISGIATPTEASSIGAVGALWLAMYKLSNNNKQKSIVISGVIASILLIIMTSTMDLRLGLKNATIVDNIFIFIAFIAMIIVVYSVIKSFLFCHKQKILTNIMEEATFTSAKIFTIFIGATFFSLVFRMLGGDEVIEQFLSGINGDIALQILIVMLVIFILGMFLDFIEIILIVIPIVAPVLLKSDISPIWLAIMIAMNLQTSFLTPPFGFTLFYLRGVAPKSLPTIQMYKGVVPFIIIQVLMLIILFIYPEITDYLPKLIFNTDFSN